MEKTLELFDKVVEEEGESLMCSKCAGTGVTKMKVGAVKAKTYCDCPAGTKKKMVDNGMGVPG